MPHGRREGPGRVDGSGRTGSIALMLAGGATPLRVEQGLFEEMLAGWDRQQRSRRLSEGIIRGRAQVVRRFAAHTGSWPWAWTPGMFEAWVAESNWAYSTVRGYQGAVAGFWTTSATRVGWVEECEDRVGTVRCRSVTRTTSRCMLRTTRAGRPVDRFPQRVADVLRRRRRSGWRRTGRRWSQGLAVRVPGLDAVQGDHTGGGCVGGRRRCSMSSTSRQSGRIGAGPVRDGGGPFGKAMRGQPTPTPAGGHGDAVGGRGRRAVRGPRSAPLPARPSVRRCG